MLLPINSLPEDSLYYLGAKMIRFVGDKQNKSASLVDVFGWCSEEMGESAAVGVLCLDWLYLIGAALVDDEGMVILCS